MRDKEIVGLWEAYLQVHQPKEEVENWVNSLIEEGYDLSEYTWEDMYEMYLDEERRDPRGRVASGPMSVYGGEGQDAGPGGSGNVNVDRMDAAQRRVKATQPKKKGMAADRLFTQYSARQQGMAHGGEEGPGPKAPKRSGRSGRGANTDRGSGNAAKRRMSEDFDLFDAILEHLVAEGYADTNESALAIMTNMSEEWRQSIVLDERNRGEQGMSDKEVSRRRNLGGNTRSTVSSDALGDHGSQGAIQKFHNRKGKLRQSIHKSGRNTRGDTGESGGKGRYEANKDHTDGYPSITKRGQGPG
jgi:hypothetical protein